MTQGASGCHPQGGTAALGWVGAVHGQPRHRRVSSAGPGPAVNTLPSTVACYSSYKGFPRMEPQPACLLSSLLRV